MSITAISDADRALLKTPLSHQYRLRLNAVPKTIVATARINQTSFTYPLAQLTIDNPIGIAGAKVGQAVWIGTTPGSYDVTAGVVKQAPTSTALYIDAKSLGDPGYASYIHSGLENDLYVTILKHRPEWGLLSSIRSGIFYKQWDIAYTNEGSNPSPIARIGRHRAVEANASGVASLTFTSNSVTWGAKTITGHSWSLDGGTAIAGSLTGTSVTAEFAPGFYVIEYTVTDSGSKTHTAFRYLWVNPYGDVGAHASFGARFPTWEIDRDSQGVQGRGFDLTLSGTLTTDDVFPGQAFLLTEDAWFGGQQLSDEDSRVHTCIAYVSDVRPMRQKVQRRISLKLLSPLEAAASVPTAPQLVSETPSPVNWAQATSTLTNPVGGVWYILRHHAPTFLAAHDFEFVNSLKTYREQSLKFQQDDLAAQLTTFDSTMPGTLGCRSDGTFVLTPSPMHMSNADRNALPIKFVWDGGDLRADTGLDYPFDFSLKVGQVKALAFAYAGETTSRPYASLAPGKAQAQGKGKAQVTFNIPAGTSGPLGTEQARLNELSGHQFAAENAPTPELGFTADRNIDVAEPCDRHVWHQLDIPPELDPYGIGFYQQRCVPSRVTRTWKRSKTGTFVKTVRVEFLLETYGQLGVTIPVEKQGWEDWVLDGWNEQLGVDFDPKIELDQGGDDGEGPPAGPGEVLVNFGASSWSDWTNESSFGGVFGIESGGLPGNCAVVRETQIAVFIGDTFSTSCKIRVNLAPGVTVTSIEVDYYAEWDVGTLNVTQLETIFSMGSFNVAEPIVQGWGNRIDSGLSVIFSTVDVEIRVAGVSLVTGDITAAVKLDNIRITYTP